MRWLRPKFVLAVLLFATGAFGQDKPAKPLAVASFKPAKCLPVDEASKDPSFVAFRNQLMRAIRRRDLAFVRSIVSPGIRFSFGGDEGIKRFEELWNIESPKSKFWKELHEVLRLGGTFGYAQAPSKDTFWAPYVFSRLEGDSLEVFVQRAVIGQNVRVRTAPSKNASILTTLSYDVVHAIGDEAEEGSSWSKIQLPDGRSGYVLNTLLRSSVDYRAAFTKMDGKWMMTLFVAGD